MGKLMCVYGGHTDGWRLCQQAPQGGRCFGTAAEWVSRMCLLAVFASCVLVSAGRESAYGQVLQCTLIGVAGFMVASLAVW